MPITPADLASLLGETYLQGVTHFNETDSTNTQAIALLSTNAILDTPHLVYAESQTSGRGRASNQWWSSRGSLTFSVILDCAQLGLAADQKLLLPLATGLAILRTGQSFLPGSPLAVKWPNDVYLSGRKLAGVLSEAPSRSPHHVVIGVGLNVNNQFDRAPEELQSTGISFSDECGHSLSRLDVLGSFLKHLEAVNREMAAGKSILKDWPQYCLLTGKQVTLQTGASEITGTCHGIDATGALLLDAGNGEQRFLGGVVKSWV